MSWDKTASGILVPAGSARTPRPTQRRSYAAARPSRLTQGWQASTTSADSELYSSFTVLRDRSRALCRDSSYALRARRIVQNNVIGAGIGIQADVLNSRGEKLVRANDGIEAAWKQWGRGDFCHTGGALHFSDIERQLLGQIFETGEVFVREHYSEFGRSGIPYALEIVESERVPNDFAGIAARPDARMGIEMDPYFRPQAYWVRDLHPTDVTYSFGLGSEQVRRVPASEIIHLRIIDRWPQTRGEPWLHAAAKKLNDMDYLSEAELVASRAAANIVGAYEGSIDFVDMNQSEDAAQPQAQEDGTFQTELAAGQILTPPPGTKFSLHSPNRPNSAFDPFMRYMLREMSVGAMVPYEPLSGDYSQSNYSSSRLSLLDSRDWWRALQLWFIRAFRERVHRAWLRQAVLVGAVEGVSINEYAVNPQKFECAKYKPRGWGWVDPTKEVEAYKEAIRGGLTTRTKVISMTADGMDIEDVDRERSEELANAAALGLKFDTDPQAEEKQPAAPDEPEEPAEPDEADRGLRVVK
jgi:lambda family phage portal protein